jgi:plasmid maintenance system antidote protein VapI
MLKIASKKTSNALISFDNRQDLIDKIAVMLEQVMNTSVDERVRLQAGAQLHKLLLSIPRIVMGD